MRRLTESEKTLLAPYIPRIDLDGARLLEGKVPRWLRKKYIGVTLENRIYLRSGVYDSGSVRGLAVLGHELVHVGQYRAGMTRLKYLWACRRGYGRNRYEIPAYAKEKEILQTLTNGFGSMSFPSRLLRENQQQGDDHDQKC
jgi:Domain of unknown function (DUF4157)